MSEMLVPFDKVDYVNCTNEIYNDCSYNRISLELDSGNNLRTSVSFYWKSDASVPVELLEFIKNNGINLNIKE